MHEEETRRMWKALEVALDSIIKLFLHLDMLVLQIGFFQKYDLTPSLYIVSV